MELCRGAAGPTPRDAEALKRLMRYLLERQRLVVYFGWQPAPGAVEVYIDSDWTDAPARASRRAGAL